MHAFVANLTAALLFIHTTLGCCWHHAHQCEHLSNVATSAACCQHHQCSDEGQQPETPCQCKVECQGICTYIVPQKVKVEAPQWVASKTIAILPSLAGSQIPLLCSWESGLPLPDWVPPLRLHLLHQVFLN